MPWSELLHALITIFASIGASTGFWAYATKKQDRKNDATKLLLGLAHDRIISLGMKYIERGWITKDEYEDFRVYLYDPYAAQGGNGLAERVMQEICQLPIWKPADNQLPTKVAQ